ncbi:MAG: putative 4-hydroxy-4-methyl-2-oxoglutarate aldolase [Gammaproteobacteria bacterium]|nr:putative 4-hydroxy-4-methyl-2-oxoglutarate aldolase [Gammaproteobacteria bacterium]
MLTATHLSTADLCDGHEQQLQVCQPLLRHFGGREEFQGEIVTLRCIEDNSLVREALSEPGHGKVLVVDGGGSLRCALLGDKLAALAVQNGWEGIVINGCIRDSAQIAEMDIGVMALATHPRKSVKLGCGRRHLQLNFAGVYFMPGQYLYCDADGILLADAALEL